MAMPINITVLQIPFPIHRRHCLPLAMRPG